MMSKADVLGLTRRPFTVYDADWKLVCMLASRCRPSRRARPETTPDRKPGMAVTYEIRPEARWGDGTPITTRDVTFTWQVGRHPKSGVMPQEFYPSLYRIDAADDRTFTLHFDKRLFDYNAIDSLELLPAHIEGEAFADPEAYQFRTRYATETTNKGLYNGPYVIAEVVAGSHVVLTRNPEWWGEPPAFSRIAVRSIDNTAALEANLLSGAIDMIAGEIGLNVDQAVALEARQGGRFRVILQAGAGLRARRRQSRQPDARRPPGSPGAALRARPAGNRRPALRRPAADRRHQREPARPDVRGGRPAYDADAAARLLDEAGWGRLANGVRVDAAGTPLRLEIMTTAGDRTRELVQQVLQSQWKRAGIDVRIRNQPARVFFGDTVSRRRFSALAMFAWISAPESVPRTTLHSNEIPTAKNGWAGQNYGGFRNAEADTLIDAIEVELDEGKRRALWRTLQATYAEELPSLPLFFRANPFVLPPWLKGLVATGHQYPTTLWVENWSTAE